MSVRITAAGVVAVVLTVFFAGPVSACDERFIKRCEKASAAEAASADSATEAPVAKRKTARRVTVVIARQARTEKRTRAPRFASRAERGMGLASAESRMVAMPRESALTRRFRGFIDPLPMAQNAFETLRKPHIVAENLELPQGATMTDATETAEAAAAPVMPAAAAISEPAVVANAAAAKADRPAPKPAAMELASAESKPVVLAPAPTVAPAPIAAPAPVAAPAVAKSSMFSANAAPSPAVPQSFASEVSVAAPAEPAPSPFSIHHLVLALCGALGAAGALRFVVGA